MVPDIRLLLAISLPLSGSVASSMGGTEAAYATLHDQFCLLVQNCLKMKEHSLDAFFMVGRLSGRTYDLGSTLFPLPLLPLPPLTFPKLEAIRRRRGWRENVGCGKAG